MVIICKLDENICNLFVKCHYLYMFGLGFHCVYSVLHRPVVFYNIRNSE